MTKAIQDEYPILRRIDSWIEEDSDSVGIDSAIQGAVRGVHEAGQLRGHGCLRQ
jgi:hypothetical protein